MKIFFTLFFCCLFLLVNTALQAQAPLAFSYQAVARGLDGKPLAAQKISLRASIRRSVPQGVVVYREFQDDLETNTFGLFTAQLGIGTPQTGAFTQIDWAQGPYFLEVEIDPANGNNFDLSSVSPLLSVPYALFAAAANEKDGDAGNEIQTLSLVGNTLTLSKNGGSVVLPTVSGGNYTAGAGIQIAGNVIGNTGDLDPNNDITNTTVAGGDLTGIYPNPQIAPGAVGSAEIIDGSITINDLTPGLIPKNLSELGDVNTTGVLNGQVLKWNGSKWVAAPDNTGSSGGTSILTQAPLTGDGSATAPVTLGQNGAANGQVLKWNGTAWLPSNDNTGANYTAGNGINITGNAISAVDISAGNELQDITLNGNNLKLTQSSATVSLAPYLQSLSYDSLTQNLGVSGGNTIKLGNLGASWWKNTGTALEPKNAASNVNIPSGILSGGGVSGWAFSKFQGAGLLSVLKSSGNGNVVLGSASGSPNSGAMSIFNPASKQVVYEYSCSHNAGEIWTLSPTAKINVDLGHDLNAEEGRLDIVGPTLLPDGGLVRLFSRNGIGNLNLLNQSNILLLDANQSALDAKGGALRIYSNNNAVARMYSDNGNGTLLLARLDGRTLATAGRSQYGDCGSFRVNGPQENIVSHLTGCAHNTGYLDINSIDGTPIAYINHAGNQPKNGEIAVFNMSSGTSPAAGFYTDTTQSLVYADNLRSSSAIFLNKTTQEWHTTIWDDQDGGFQMIRNAVGAPRIYMFVENDKGTVSADRIIGNIKNFRMDHPDDPSKEIYYACIEGPEAAAYERGTGRLVNGEVFIAYTDHFSAVINPATVTVQLTPQSADTYGLAVVEKNAKGFHVRELKAGTGNFAFDWEVKGVRKGYEDYQAVVPKSQKLQQTPAKAPRLMTRSSGKCLNE